MKGTEILDDHLIENDEKRKENLKEKFAKLRIKIIRLAIKLMHREFRKIKFKPLALFLQAQENLMIDIADVLTDEDPNNEAQLAVVWEANKNIFGEQSVTATKAAITALVKDSEEAQAIIELLDATLSEQAA